MKPSITPNWICYCEYIFAFNFVAFSFVMFSCLFPTGVSATFSTLAFICAVPVVWYRPLKADQSLFEKAGLVLFAWLTLSIVWSGAPILESLEALFEYRLYFMVPVFVVALTYCPNAKNSAFVAAMCGAIIALVISYGLGLGWWEIDGARYSLAYRIYHGFIMSSLALISMLIARSLSGFSKTALYLVAFLAVMNVLVIEDGRTGYLQVVAVCLAVAFLSCKLRTSILLAVGSIFAVGLLYMSIDRFSEQIKTTADNLERVLVNGDYQSSLGLRVEFYKGAASIIADEPLLGVGVGDVKSELEARWALGEMKARTDNVHSEFLNMFLAAGFPGFGLFVGFLLSMVWVGFSVRSRHPVLGDALIGVAVVIFVSALFNSTVKDYGEKHALLIILSLLGAQLAINCPRNILEKAPEVEN